MALVMGANVAFAAPGAVGYYPSSGGELTTTDSGSAEIDGGDLSESRSSQRAVTRSGCIAPFTVVTYSGITLPAFGSFLHSVPSCIGWFRIGVGSMSSCK